MKTISIEGFDRVEPSTGFALAVFGPDGSGKTRLIAQAQAEAYMEDMETGVIVLDSKTRDTLKQECDLLGVPMPLTNKRDYVTPQDAMKMALIDEETKEGVKEIKEFYRGVVDKIYKDAVRLADHRTIMTVSVDPFTELYDYMFFEAFGRKTQVGQLSRYAVNQHVIDFVKALRHKNLILTHRESSVYADKGKRDPKTNDVVREDTGRKKLQGYGEIGHHVSAIIQMRSEERQKPPDKFKVDVHKAQLAVGLEGEKDWLTGEEITWQAIKGGLWPK